MPYSIKKVNHGYKVFNKITGRFYSKTPQTLETAKKQYSILMRDYMRINSPIIYDNVVHKR